MLFSLVCNSQAGYTQIGFIRVVHETPDYNKHYGISTAITGFCISSIYYKTNRKWLSVLAGALISLGGSIVGKEFINDKWLKRGVFSYDDIEADTIGALNCTFVLSMSLINNSRMNKKDTEEYKLQFNNLNKIQL